MSYLRVIFLGLVLLQLSGCYAIPEFSEREVREVPKPLVAEPRELPPALPQSQRKIAVDLNINDGSGQSPANVGGQPEIIYAPSCVPAEKVKPKPKAAKKKVVKPKKPKVC